MAKKWARVYAEVRGIDDCECLAVLHASKEAALRERDRLGGVVLEVETRHQRTVIDLSFPNALVISDYKDRTLAEIEELENLYRQGDKDVR